MKNYITHLASALIVAGFVFLAFGSDNSDNSSSSEPKTRKDSVEAQFSSWDGSHPALSRLIKKNMNDPDSYEHIETKFRDDGDYIFVITKFRGKNAFGGKVINTVSAKVDFKGNVIEIVSQD